MFSSQTHEHYQLECHHSPRAQSFLGHHPVSERSGRQHQARQMMACQASAKHSRDFEEAQVRRLNDDRLPSRSPGPDSLKKIIVE